MPTPGKKRGHMVLLDVTTRSTDDLVDALLERGMKLKDGAEVKELEKKRKKDLKREREDRR